MPDPFLELRKQVTESCDAPQLFGVPSIDGFADKLLFCRHSPRSMQGLCGCIATLQVSLLNPLADVCEEPCSSGTQQTVFRCRVGKVGCCYGIRPCSHRLPLGPEVCGTCLHTRRYSSFTRLPEPPAKLRTRISKILQGSAASLQPIRGVNDGIIHAAYNYQRYCEHVSSASSPAQTGWVLCKVALGFAEAVKSFAGFSEDPCSSGPQVAFCRKC